MRQMYSSGNPYQLTLNYIQFYPEVVCERVRADFFKHLWCFSAREFLSLLRVLMRTIRNIIRENKQPLVSFKFEKIDNKPRFLTPPPP